MSSHGNATSMRDALYEAPGPKTKRKIMVGTALSAVVVAVVLLAILGRFYATGQLDARYWTFFLEWSTWRFLLQGFAGTVRVALTAGAISLVLGMLLMLGRVSKIKPLSAACRVVIDFFRGVPSLLLIYFFFLIVPQYGIKMSSFWMLTLPVALAASGVLAEVFRAGVNAVPKGQVEAAMSIGLYPDLMQNARVLITSYDALVSVYFTIALIYILINYAINKASVAVANRTGVKIIR